MINLERGPVDGQLSEHTYITQSPCEQNACAYRGHPISVATLEQAVSLATHTDLHVALHSCARDAKPLATCGSVYVDVAQ